MGKVVTGEYRRDGEKHNSERVFIAISDDTIKAFVHTVLSLKAENEEEDVGFIRFLGYERGERNAGQAVLEKAEEYFKTCNASRIYAFSQNDRYRFFHFEHAYLSDALDHVQGLLGYNGYRRSDGEVFLDWENYEVPSIEAPIPITLNVEWQDGRGQRPNIHIDAYLDDKKVGECDSLALDHVQGLLGYNGYRRSDGEVFLDWENYEVPSIEAPIPITLNVEWQDGRGQRPNIHIDAYLDDKKVGECDSLSCGEFSSHPDAQDWLHTVWLGIEEAFQGQGLGRYLLNYTLQEMHNVGYRHAAISTNWENYRALLFYSNCGYKVVDWTYEYEKVLAEVSE